MTRFGRHGTVSSSLVRLAFAPFFRAKKDLSRTNSSDLKSIILWVVGVWVWIYYYKTWLLLFLLFLLLLFLLFLLFLLSQLLLLHLPPTPRLEGWERSHVLHLHLHLQKQNHLLRHLLKTKTTKKKN